MDDQLEAWTSFRKRVFVGSNKPGLKKAEKMVEAGDLPGVYLGGELFIDLVEWEMIRKCGKFSDEDRVMLGMQ